VGAFFVITASRQRKAFI